MDFSKLKIGYVPYLPDLSQPADRRRFPYFARRNNISFEIADINKFYDIVLLTSSANLSLWIIYKRKNPTTMFIFEMADSLIFSYSIFNTLFKGIGWFILRREKSLYLSYQKLIEKWVKIADLVLCPSTEVKNIILKWNSNIIVTPDYLEHEYRFSKSDFSINGKVKLVWEGQGIVLRHFLKFKDVLKKLNSFCELHIITNDTYPMYGKIINNHVNKILKQLPIDTVFHKWDLNNNYKIFSNCDYAIIPLNKKHLFAWHKPANKLISFWFTGLPTVVSATPAYKEVMDKVDENLYCNTSEQWINKIKQIKDMTDNERKELAKKNFDFVKDNYSDEVLDRIWFNAFENITNSMAAFATK